MGITQESMLLVLSFMQCCKLQMLLFSFWNTFKICVGFVQLHLICWGVSNTQESMLHWVSVQCCKLLLLLFSFWNIFEICAGFVYIICWWPKKVCCTESVCNVENIFWGGNFELCFFYDMCRICLHNLLMTQESMLYWVGVQCCKWMIILQGGGATYVMQIDTQNTKKGKIQKKYT